MARCSQRRLVVATGTRVIQALKRDGWYVIRVRGDYVFMRHRRRRGTVKVPYHTRDCHGESCSAY